MSEVHNFSKNLSHFKILSTIAKKKKVVQVTWRSDF